jgi:putative DNA primase/helicase
MLNKLLERFPLLLSEGIDYKATKDAMQKAQEESRHLWQFVRDVGIEVQTGGRIYIKDLWNLLQKWYVETGTLEIEEGNNGKNKLIWHDLPNKYDTPVKAINQVFARFSEIFPKILRREHTEGNSLDPRKSQWYLSGITFVQNPGASEEIALLALLPCSEGDTALLMLYSNKKMRQQVEQRVELHLCTEPSRASRAILATAADFVECFAQLPDSERQKLTDCSWAFLALTRSKLSESETKLLATDPRMLVTTGTAASLRFTRASIVRLTGQSATYEGRTGDFYAVL